MTCHFVILTGITAPIKEEDSYGMGLLTLNMYFHGIRVVQTKCKDDPGNFLFSFAFHSPPKFIFFKVLL